MSMKKYKVIGTKPIMIGRLIEKQIRREGGEVFEADSEDSTTIKLVKYKYIEEVK